MNALMQDSIADCANVKDPLAISKLHFVPLYIELRATVARSGGGKLAADFRDVVVVLHGRGVVKVIAVSVSTEAVDAKLAFMTTLSVDVLQGNPEYSLEDRRWNLTDGWNMRFITQITRGSWY